MTWFYLILAGLFEVVWSSTMKLSEGFTQISWTMLTVIGMIASFGFLALSLKHLPLSLAYPIWTGVGAVGSIIVGVFLFGDKVSTLTWLFIILLVIGIIGIKVTSGH
ncbi:multidrug efflux SMR transporter [Weissella paramesenteroides]|uniref:Multidrug efflux SMR transporter n=1 Tax=Weissella paramesenteroides TaxID=1249 RepID=A0ABD4XJB2_WEIPA|nr:multidrug efflux SMR transporter [Weissella paramesenteroides]MDF8369297.1 multidrug efflux SMR transporter [Weissella paramesenteroides]MDF8371310.1 multidrug efflux SMR transporter [Weissella paramesenteroides]MDF8374045.1 multidrug efflux SMR transporter [Weissella paramesenteroides]NEZ89946.1 multidrug efflux SMR transporter [Weissella paramesenteroides]NFB04329.1 multidrug efflux SMR transporter [Weissella paramesenteroides]